MSTPSNLPFRPGDMLAGKYRIERVLGAGGMGVVVSAYHLHLEERVAIKILQAQALADSVTVARFLREGRAAAQIQNEHVARVRDVGTLDDGAPYIVMEYLEGSDLDALVKSQGPLPIVSAVSYILQACEAIAEAHSLGIVHRDIKPSNLFLASRRDGSAITKVIDFGISKVTQGADAGMDITKTAEMRGSLLFISPEQMSSPKNVDPRSDIWSLGVTLHFLLSRKYPFKASQVPELCALILQSPPTPLRHDRPDAPPALEAIVATCLQKNPVQRFANVADFAEALLPLAPGAAPSVERIRRLIGGRRSEVSPPNVNTQSLGLEAQTAGKSSWASTRGRTTAEPANPGLKFAVAAGVFAALLVAALLLWLIRKSDAGQASTLSAEPAAASNSIEFLAPSAASVIPQNTIELAPSASPAPPPPSPISAPSRSGISPSPALQGTSNSKPASPPKNIATTPANPVPSSPPKNEKKKEEIF